MRKFLWMFLIIFCQSYILNGAPYLIFLLDDKTHSIKVEETDTIGAVIDRFCNLTGCSANMVRLTYAGKSLEPYRTLANYSILEDSTIFVNYRLSPTTAYHP
jgi:hypothetical protein